MKRQGGGAILVFLLILGVVAGYFALTLFNSQNARDRLTANALAQAKEALIGQAAANRTNNQLGFLPMPDLGSTRNSTPLEGNTAGNFAGNTKNLSVLGRLPWRTLGIADLRDASGECLWYALSGSGQGMAVPDVFNWDSVGHFDIYSSNGTAAGTVSTTGVNYHDRPIALIFSAGLILAGQSRVIGADDVTQCGGNYDVRNYLDSFNPNVNINNIQNFFGGTLNSATGYAYGLTAASNASLLTLAQLNAPKAIVNGNVDTKDIANDRVIGITAKEIFDRVKKRSDFKNDIDTLLGDLSNYLNGLLVATLPASSVGNKGIDNVLNGFIAANPAAYGVGTQKRLILDNWRNNLLYTKPAATATVNGVPNCSAVLFFGGERTTRTVAPLTAQTRITAAQKGDAANFGDAAMYLEGVNAALFPNSGAYVGGTSFNGQSASTDLVRCIVGLPASAAQQSFANNFASFNAAGSGVTADNTTNTLTIASPISGTTGGCFRLSTPVTLATPPTQGKVLRAFYEFQFAYADDFTLAGPNPDRGYGFTLQLIRGDFGPPIGCGKTSDMGALDASSGASLSFIFETDVRRNAGHSDPAENHSAIMVNGNLDHSQPGNTLSTTCNGTTTGCRQTPANKFEEGDATTNTPSPSLHNQRLEIHTGCNATCSACNPANHVAPTNYARLSAWVDCTDCNDLVSDINRALYPPTVQRCVSIFPAPPPFPEMNTVYVGFTGGFTAVPPQAVTIKNFYLRTE